MNKIASLLLIFITILIVLIVLIDRKQPIVIVNHQLFKVDLAKTDNQKQKGLSIYSSLPSDKGMLFLFDKPDYYTFWMKDMKFSIDIVYINNNQIVDIYPNISAPKSKDQQPSTVEPRQPANKVLEINAGLSKKYKFKIGDLVKINI